VIRASTQIERIGLRSTNVKKVKVEIIRNLRDDL
jgi:hypothetical protein